MRDAPAGNSGTVDPRTRRLLEGPIVPTLLKLAAPQMVLLLVQSSIGLIEAYWVGKLGTDAQAGVALVFPALMLMQMMSAGAMGGGISSAIARAIGAQRVADANALVIHALIIAAALGITFGVIMLTAGRALYTLMGGHGATLAAALTYSNLLFAGIVLLWIFNALASVLRGTGNLVLPAMVATAGAVLVIPLSPLLIFGWGPFPQWGVAGGAAAVLLYYAGAIPFLAHAIWSGRNVVRPALRTTRIRWVLLYEILRVGLVAAAITVTTNLTVALTTGLVGRAGSQAIAGYGIGSRLEYLLIPVAFRMGAPLVAMVGTCIGASKLARHPARRLAGCRDCRHGRRVDRRRCRFESSELDDFIQRRSGGHCQWLAIFAHRRAVLRLLRRRHGFVLFIAGRGTHDVAASGGVVAPRGGRRGRVARLLLDAGATGGLRHAGPGAGGFWRCSGGRRIARRVGICATAGSDRICAAMSIALS